MRFGMERRIRLKEPSLLLNNNDVYPLFFVSHDCRSKFLVNRSLKYLGAFIFVIYFFKFETI